MRYEFSWHNEGDVKTFTTSSPAIGEMMMLSSTDFPKRSEKIQQQFDALYGTERGKFEELLREASIERKSGMLVTGIEGLSIHASEDSGVHMC